MSICGISVCIKFPYQLEWYPRHWWHFSIMSTFFMKNKKRLAVDCFLYVEKKNKSDTQLITKP